MGLSLPQLLLILLIILVLFGAGRIPRVMGDVGKGIRSLREGLKDEEEGIPPASSQHKTIEHNSKAENTAADVAPAEKTKD